VRLDDARDLPRVARHLERDPIVAPQALREQLELLGPGRDPPRRAKLTVLDERHLAEIQMHV
jgi:hypothetical protein